MSRLLSKLSKLRTIENKKRIINFDKNISKYAEKICYPKGHLFLNTTDSCFCCKNAEKNDLPKIVLLSYIFSSKVANGEAHPAILRHVKR